MCIICTMATPSDPSIHDYIEPMNATVFEGSDAAESTSTIYTMSVGDTFVGELATSTDEDWVAIQLTAGDTYQIDLQGIGTSELSDPYLTLFDSSGSYVDHNDDSNGSYDSSLTITASYTGTYYIEADAYSTQTGDYEISVAGVSSPEPESDATLDELAYQLTHLGWGGTSYTWNSNTVTVDLTGLTSDGAQLARWAMEAWEMVADLDFVEVTSGADIVCNDHYSGAWAYAPGGSEDDADGTVLNVSTNWLASYGTTIDSYSFQTYVHEFGHAIGLGHMGDYDGSAVWGVDNDYANDSWQVSLMSYFDQTENTNINASYGLTSGPMIADVLAIQNLYGAPDASTSATAGNTTHGANSNLSNYLGAVYDWWSTGATSSDINGSAMVFNIHDVSGHDTLDLSFTSSGDRVDMRQETFSDVHGMTGNLSISRGTIIEDLIAGSGNDTVSGNSVANDIRGGAGHDDINGFGGNDYLRGEGGDDSLLGGFGFDTIEGGIGNDTIYGEGNADRLYGGSGNDQIFGGDGTDHLYGDEGNDSLYGGTGADRLYGGDGDDLIRAGTNFGTSVDGVEGGAGNDTIFGEGGYDLLIGGTGDDWIHGGDQADNLYGGEGNDTIYGGAGFDRLFGGADDDLLIDMSGFGGFFGGTGNDTMQGGDDATRFFGGQGDDLIEAGGGDDTIGGNAGFDTIDSGAGNDLIYGDFNADTFVFNEGHGQDTIADFDALNDFERIDLSGLSGISLGSLNLGSASTGDAVQDGTDVLIDTGGGNSITLIGVNIADLDSADFIF
ncbi:hypothetical protein DZK27_01430 [Rhodobacteraceae bacterium 63075]|nr:hypothetical protein DZK27_01430 [Rhodobacteraceae bacterium 63075]